MRMIMTIHLLLALALIAAGLFMAKVGVSG